VVLFRRDLSPDECRKLTPAHAIPTKARCQPQQLEALVLTMLRSSRHAEEIVTAGIVPAETLIGRFKPAICAR